MRTRKYFIETLYANVDKAFAIVWEERMGYVSGQIRQVKNSDEESRDRYLVVLQHLNEPSLLFGKQDGRGYLKGSIWSHDGILSVQKLDRKYGEEPIFGAKIGRTEQCPDYNARIFFGIDRRMYLNTEGVGGEVYDENDWKVDRVYGSYDLRALTRGKILKDH
jgi:hypothetical protein